MESSSKINSCLSLLRRLPPQNIEMSVAGLNQLLDDENLQDEVIQRADQPLVLENDNIGGKSFLKCEYNRDGDSYRSPWTNKYFPATAADAIYPSNELLQMEQKANDVFQQYAMLYFDQAYTSVYFFDTDEYGGFGACFLVKKEIDAEAGLDRGCWDSIHSVTVTFDGPQVKYRVVSTVILSMGAKNQKFGELDIAGTLTRTLEENVKKEAKMTDEFHIGNIGKLIESNETQMRTDMDSLYIGKSKQIINTGRLREDYMTGDERSNFHSQLKNAQAKLKLGTLDFQS